jgi:hypothetical protein
VLAWIARQPDGQQIGDAKHRILCVLAEVYPHGFAILFDDHAVQGKGHGGPLIFL